MATEIDPEINLMAVLNAQLNEYGPKTRAQVAMTMREVLTASADMEADAIERATQWALERAVGEARAEDAKRSRTREAPAASEQASPAEPVNEAVEGEDVTPAEPPEAVPTVPDTEPF